MICCKIIANYDDVAINFSGLCMALSDLGPVKWDNGSIYFYSDEEKINEKRLSNILKKYKIDRFYIEEFNEKHLPQENSSINGWVLDALVKINSKKFLLTSDKTFTELSEKMDNLERELDIELQKIQKQNKEE